MDLSVYAKDFTQHDLFGLFPGAPGGRALRDTYGRIYLVTIATKGGQTTLERFGRDYMRELASRGGKAKRHKQDTQPRNVTHWMARPSGTFPIVRRAAVLRPKNCTTWKVSLSSARGRQA